MEFVRHLADRGAPCPNIRPTTDGSPCKSVRDLVISVESFLEGEVVDRVDTLRNVGEALARVHDASEDFPIYSSEVKDARLYISDALEYCERTTFSSNAADAVTRLRAQLKYTPNKMNVRWLFCRGDVRSWNTIASPSGEVRFTDFNSAHFAPALVDVVMVRMQWLMGTVGRQLTDEEMQRSWRGTSQSGLPQMMNVPHSRLSSRPTMPGASASSTGNGVRGRLIGKPGNWKTEFSLSRMRRFVWARLQSKHRLKGKNQPTRCSPTPEARIHRAQRTEPFQTKM